VATVSTSREASSTVCAVPAEAWSATHAANPQTAGPETRECSQWIVCLRALMGASLGMMYVVRFYQILRFSLVLRSDVKRLIFSQHLEPHRAVQSVQGTISRRALPPASFRLACLVQLSAHTLGVVVHLDSSAVIDLVDCSIDMGISLDRHLVGLLLAANPSWHSQPAQFSSDDIVRIGNSNWFLAMPDKRQFVK
jgi:hypothetical protein